MQFSFSFVAFPCLVLQYMGQAAYLIHHPETYSNAFWSAVPKPVFWPMFVIGTLAAIVASQVDLTLLSRQLRMLFRCEKDTADIVVGQRMSK